MEPSVEINGGQEHSVRHMVPIQGQDWSQAAFILTPQKPLAAHRDPHLLSPPTSRENSADFSHMLDSG